MTDKAQKIRVLHIIGNLRFGGVQVVVKQIVENSNPVHFQHYIYSLRPQPNEMSIRGEIIEHGRFRYDIRKFFDLIKICREKKIDIVHAHLYKSILGGLLLTFFCPVKVVVHEHGPIYKGEASRPIYQFFLRLLHHRSTAVIANSHATMEALHRYAGISPKAIDVIPNAADLARFQPNPEKRLILRQHNRLRDNDIVVGFVGRLRPVKGVDCLVKAMAILLKHNPLFHLVMVGSGPLEKSLKRTARKLGLEDHIHFTGYHEDVSEIINMFDIGCMPSQQESFGIAAIEMMSMKVPLVCSAAEGLAEITEHKKTALHLGGITPEAIAQSIIELSENNSLRQMLRDNAFRSSQQYSIEKFVGRVEDLYHRIASRPES